MIPKNPMNLPPLGTPMPKSRTDNAPNPNAPKPVGGGGGRKPLVPTRPR